MKQDKWFSVIVALSMLMIALISIFNPIDYIKHIADVIVLPLFFFTILETIGHIKNSIYQRLEFEIKQAERDEEWFHRDYDRVKDGTDEYAVRTKKQYEDLIKYIVKLGKEKEIIVKWFRFYNWLYILFGVILLTAAFLANLGLVNSFMSNINVTAVTLLTFVIFVSEAWVVDILANKIRKMAIEQVNSWVEKG